MLHRFRACPEILTLRLSLLLFDRRGILPSLVNLKARLFEAATDTEGVEPLLWTTSYRIGPPPKQPKTHHSQNSSTPLQQAPTHPEPRRRTRAKRSILAIVRKHNLLLLEDDPYYF